MKNYFEGTKTVSNRPPVRTPEQERQALQELEAREAERKRIAQQQATAEAVKRETGEIPLISDEEYEATARRFGITVNKR